MKYLDIGDKYLEQKLSLSPVCKEIRFLQLLLSREIFFEKIESFLANCPSYRATMSNNEQTWNHSQLGLIVFFFKT